MQKSADMFFGLDSVPPVDSTATFESDPVPGEPVTSDPLPEDVDEYCSLWVWDLISSC